MREGTALRVLITEDQGEMDAIDGKLLSILVEDTDREGDQNAI
jgi:hypothetical protein